MIFDMPSIHFEDKEWLYILEQYLNGWTNIPLTEHGGYDFDLLKFYDGFIGLLLKQTEECLKQCPDILDRTFVDSWKYQGKLYRIIHKRIINNNKTKEGISCRMPKVQYHGMISHWTDDYTFGGLMYKLSSKEKYIILEADTKEHLGFDVNKFRKAYNCEKPNTEKEREIIFPMYKGCIKEYRMSVNEFIQLKENR